MPKAKKKPVSPVAPTPVKEESLPPPQPSDNGLPVIYPTLELAEFSTTSPNGPLTVDTMKQIMGWETEAEYKKRKCSEDPSSKPEHHLYGDDYHCKNLKGEKVRCTNNLNNRPFDETWCKDLIHTILSGQWAGPHTIPGKTINGETVRISEYGRVISGQHQMTACILAGEYLLRDREGGLDHPDHPRYPTWVKHGQPFLETIVVTGMSEDVRVLMTVDYVKPRTVADVFYTSGTFKDASNQDRKELCRILATACDFLWTRTDARGYRTHLEIVGFLDRHPHLLDCVEHLFKLNRATKIGGRRISSLHLSIGQCSALCYIMACAGSETDGDEYRNMNPAPAEKGLDSTGKKIALDFSYWEKATEVVEVDGAGVLTIVYRGKAADYWTQLAGFPGGSGDCGFTNVRKALGQLVTSKVDSEDNLGQGGRLPEKLAILAGAWERWKDHPDTAGPAFTESDRRHSGCLFLTYVDYDATGKKYPDGKVDLVDVADFYGIDCPASAGKSKSSRVSEPPPPTHEEIWGDVTTLGATDRLREEAQTRRNTAEK